MRRQNLFSVLAKPMVRHTGKHGKSATPAAKPNAKSNAISTSSAAEAKAAPKPVCEFLKFDPCVCTSCGQNTHSLERDSLDDNPEYLTWTKTNVCAKGRKPTGSERYKYAGTRQRYYATASEKGGLLSQSELNAKKEGDQQFCDTWTDQRRARVQGDDAYKHLENDV